MTLTPHQIKILKNQLLAQIEKLPEPQRSEARRQIESLSPKALELMLKQQEKKQEKVFRLIIEEKIPSTKIEENEDAIAVLEINPISTAHAIIIPKKPAKSSNELPEKAFQLAKNISNKIINKLNAKSTEIQIETKFGEAIINIIPIYKEPLNINSERKRAKKEELEKIKEELIKEEKKIEIIKIEKKPTQLLKLKRKIP